MMTINRIFSALALTLCLASPAMAKKKPAIQYEPSFAAPVVPQAAANGGIFQATSGYAPLTSGSRAGQVGDIITINLVESMQASKSNAANTSHDGSFGLTPPTTGILSKLVKSSDVTASGTNSFAGAGKASQSNSLSGEIAVTVAQVYPNGVMLVRGQKALTLNRGDEFIQIEGLVRAADISPDNRVLSTRVANAKITYTGKGEIARASRQGWLQRFFTMITPF
jgi:flagellar L-ring protein FlgH